ncbi:HPr family phosphocarrier protein [Nocardioides sp.]|uniref:HPr family phosphocarrier protein n=1 Tax=Nocardioides sp. TaxID=35761 RepID=UPI002620E181|nr:HPr family phosphocarrier protein [Nocardioides sp.]MCW2735835.1 serine kinase [Nocardioides sp.]
MHRRFVVVGSAVGLHARPAALIAEATANFGSPVYLSLSERGEVDAGSALMIMTLSARQGDIVVVSSEDQAAMDLIAELVEKDLDT